MKNTLFIWAILFSFNLAACQHNKQMEEKFDWNPGISAAKYYPADIYLIRFIYSNGNSVSMPTPLAGTGGCEWGTDNGGVAVGADLKPVPIRLDITWLSYTENQFYTGNFILPHDTMLSILEDANTRGKTLVERMNTITAGVAPGGIVVVWIETFEQRIEVARFQAQKTTISMEEFLGRSDLNIDQTTYVKNNMEYASMKDVRNNLAAKGIPFGLWDIYRERFNWRPIIEYNKPECQTTSIDCYYYNGEFDYGRVEERLLKNEYKYCPRTKKIMMDFNGKHNGKPQAYVDEIVFDEKEIFDAYKEIYGNDPTQPGELFIKINLGEGDSGTTDLFLRNKNKQVKLTKAKTQIYYKI